MQVILDKAILASRYLLVVFYLGLAVALAFYAVSFLIKLWSFAKASIDADMTDQLISLLHLLDSALIASLVVTIALSSYDSLVSRIGGDDETARAKWVADIDPDNLKTKLAVALVAISSIQLLQVFMKVDSYDDRAVYLSLMLHGMFLLGALALGLVDWMTASSKKARK